MQSVQPYKATYQTESQLGEYSKNFVGDAYGNSAISLAIERGDISKVRNMIPPDFLDKDTTDAHVLKKIALQMTDAESLKAIGIGSDVALRIYSESIDQLNLIGEDISEIIDAYVA